MPSIRWTDGSTYRPKTGSKFELRSHIIQFLNSPQRMMRIHFRKIILYVGSECNVPWMRWIYSITYVQDWKNNFHPESEMNCVTVIVLNYVTWNRVVSDSNITWIMVESTSGMKSLYFEETNCTVLASYFHIRKGSTDQSPQNDLKAMYPRQP